MGLKVTLVADLPKVEQKFYETFFAAKARWAFHLQEGKWNNSVYLELAWDGLVSRLAKPFTSLVAHGAGAHLRFL